MTTRVSTLKAGTFLSGGATRVSTLKAGAFVSVPEFVRVSTLKLGAFVDDHTNGIRVTTLRLAGWVSLSDQGLYLQLPPFGSNEVWTPDISSVFQPEAPPVPVVEVNPYRADVPNVDQQRILREQHNLTQAGDSTFHWGVLTEVSATPLYNLGSIGRFYHDEFGISVARYCKFTSFVECTAKAFPVGVNRKLNQPWTVTNQLELSDQDGLMGVAVPYNPLVFSGSWFGWVIIDGFVPAEMDITLASDEFEWWTEYGWSETGKVKPGVQGPKLGNRFTTSKTPNLKPGEFLVKVDSWSTTRLTGLITAQVEAIGDNLSALTDRVVTLEGKVTTHTQQIGQLQTQVVGLDNRITKESEATAKQLASIRALMPDVNYKQYVDSIAEQLTIKIDTQDGIIGQIANNALAKVNELELKFEAQSTTALQEQIDALNDSMGGLTGRLVGFTTEIDTNVLTAGQVLVSVDAGLTPGGTQLYTFQPVDLAISSLIDVDLSTPQADGQVLVWDAGAGKWIPGDGGGGGGGGGFPVIGMPSTLTASGSTSDTFFGNRIMPLEDLNVTGIAYLCNKFGSQQFRFHLVEVNNSSGAGTITSVLATTSSVVPAGATNVIVGGVVDITPTTLLAGGYYAVVAENMATDPVRLRNGGGAQTYGGVAAYCIASFAGSVAVAGGASFLNSGVSLGLGIRVE